MGNLRHKKAELAELFASGALFSSKRLIITVSAILGFLICGILGSGAADGTDGIQKFLQLIVGGAGLGFIYALIALGFVIIYKATGVFNFAHGGFILMGAYLSYQFTEDWGAPFVLGIFASIISMAAVGAFLERTVMRPMLGKPPYATVLITLGLLLIIDQVVRAAWTKPAYIMTAPWQGNQSTVFGVVISHGDLWNAAIAVLLLLMFWLLFQFTRLGLSMRATAIDHETAASQGVRVGLAFSASWMIAAGLGAIAGTLLVFESGSSATPALSAIALRAFPAMILGGLDSVMGAVVAGVVLGIAEVLTQGYVDIEWLGTSFETIVPYLLMIGVLLWRPHGFFGTKTVERL